MRARRSSFEWPRLISIHLTTWINGALMFWALLGRVPWCLPVPLASGIWEVEHAGSRLSRARCECMWVEWEGLHPSESV